MKKSSPQSPGTPFLNYLVDLGLYNEFGAPRPHLHQLVEYGTSKPLGWFHEVGRFGADGFDSDEPPFWTHVELIVPHYRMVITAWSDTFNNIDHPASHFSTREVRWQLGSRMVCSPMIWGIEARWRKYMPGRVEEAIKAGIGHLPFIRFQLRNCVPLGIALDENSLANFLANASESSRTVTENQKLQEKLVHFFYRCDHDGFPDQVRQVVTAHPILLPSLHALLPEECDLTDSEYHLGKTVKMLATLHVVGHTTIRRAISALGCRPLSSRRPFIYSHADCARIADVVW